LNSIFTGQGEIFLGIDCNCQGGDGAEDDVDIFREKINFCPNK
jgi:hypothetical protein